MMTHALLKLAHVIGVVLMGGGLIAVWVADMRSRQSCDLVRFSEAVRYIPVFYDGVVVPGALILLGTGAWLTVEFYGGWEFMKQPWLTGMLALFAFEFIEGNTVTRLYFMRMRQLTNVALEIGCFTPELEQERAKLLPSFTHFLDLPMYLLIVSLGVLKPDSWAMFFAGAVVATLVATALTAFILRLYPCEAGEAPIDR